MKTANDLPYKNVEMMLLVHFSTGATGRIKAIHSE